MQIQKNSSLYSQARKEKISGKASNDNPIMSK